MIPKAISICSMNTASLNFILVAFSLFDTCCFRRSARSRGRKLNTFGMFLVSDRGIWANLVSTSKEDFRRQFMFHNFYKFILKCNCYHLISNLFPKLSIVLLFYPKHPGNLCKFSNLPKLIQPLVTIHIFHLFRWCNFLMWELVNILWWQYNLLH